MKIEWDIRMSKNESKSDSGDYIIAMAHKILQKLN